MADSAAIKYRAFLSYSHRDMPWAKWLHAELEGYRIDKDLVGRQTPAGAVPKTLRPIFRDREDFSAGPSLTEQTMAALEASQFLIVLCSPNAAKSKYVNEEILRFKALGRANRVIPLIIDGEPGDPERECFPPAVRFKVGSDGTLTDEREEPIAADARPQGDGKEIATQKLVAGILSVGFDEIVRRAERARKRRNRFWAALAGVFLLLAILATGGFVWARYELGRNEALLDRTLQRATGLVDKSVAMSEQFGVPRGVSVGILEEAEGLFRDMAELGRQTPQLRYRKAEMLIAFARNYAVLGQTEAQRVRVTEANRIMQALASEFPAKLDWQSDLAVTYEELGAVLAVQGSLDEAIKNYQASLVIRQRLASADPTNGNWQRNLFVSHDKVGDVLKTQGKLADASKNYRASLAIAEHLAAADPKNARWQGDLSVSYDKVADVLFAEGRLVEALRTYRASLAIRQRLVAENPRSAGWQHDLAVSHSKIGQLLVAGRLYDLALKSFRDGHAIIERLAAADPANAGWQRDLAVSHDNIGDALYTQGSFEEALKQYGAAHVIFERIAAADPKNTGWRHDLLVSHDKVGDTLGAKDSLVPALKSYRAALAIAERLVATDPSNTGWQRDLWVAHDKIGNALVAQNKPDDALKNYRAGLAAMQRLAAAHPAVSAWQRNLTVSYDKIGNVLLGQGAPDEALKSFRESLGIRMRLAAAAPDHPGTQRDLAVSYYKVAGVMAARAEREAAINNYRAGLAIVERLCAADPGNIDCELDAVSLNRGLAVTDDDAARRFAYIAATLRRIAAQRKLSVEQQKWLAEAEERLATMPEVKPR